MFRLRARPAGGTEIRVDQTPTTVQELVPYCAPKMDLTFLLLFQKKKKKEKKGKLFDLRRNEATPKTIQRDSTVQQHSYFRLGGFRLGGIRFASIARFQRPKRGSNATSTFSSLSFTGRFLRLSISRDYQKLPTNFRAFLHAQVNHKD